MTHTARSLLQGLCAAGMCVALLSGSAQPALGGAGYRAAPQGVEIPAEMQHYDPSMLHITFGQPAEPDLIGAAAETTLPQNADPDTLFDPARLPEKTAGQERQMVQDPGASVSPEGLQSASVPEPGTLALLGLGLGLAALLVRRRKIR